MDWLVKVGCIVKRISAPGVPDLLCWHQSTGYFLLEVKNGKGRLTSAQKAQEMPFGVVRTVDEASAYFLAKIRKFKE